MPNYAISKQVKLPYIEAVQKVREALKEEGFGVITEIDVKNAVQEKLGEEFRPFIILGACNPRVAHQALSTVPEIGVLMPCNVCVWDNGDGSSTVSAIDVEVLFSLVEEPGLQEAAVSIRAALSRAVEKTGSAVEASTS